jgi:hypothetical protein
MNAFSSSTSSHSSTQSSKHLFNSGYIPKKGLYPTADINPALAEVPVVFMVMNPLDTSQDLHDFSFALIVAASSFVPCEASCHKSQVCLLCSSLVALSSLLLTQCQSLLGLGSPSSPPACF